MYLIKANINLSTSVLSILPRHLTTLTEMLYKLMNQKIGNKMLNTIMSMYDKAKARVNHLGNIGDVYIRLIAAMVFCKVEFSVPIC